MTVKQKIRIEIIPEDNVDINKLRNDIHSLLNSNREGCGSIRAWIETLKNCEAVHLYNDGILTDAHKCMLTEGHKENHKCYCGHTWDII